MARYYQTLAPARYQVRNGIRGGWFVCDTQPTSYSRMEEGEVYFKDAYAHIYKNDKLDYWRTYDGAKNAAQRLNAKG